MLMETIRKDMFEAKKVKDTVKSNLLSTLFSEMFNQSKSGKEFTADDELKIIRKFLKNIDDTLQLDIPDDSKTKMKTEKEILESYLPKQMTKEEIENIVSGLVAEGKTMKEIMPHFKEHYNGEYDGRTVSEIVKSKST